MAEPKANEQMLDESKPLVESTLVVTPEGKIYHLDIFPEQLAQNIIIVGDPDRVPILAKVLLHDTEFDHAHRGLRTITGHAASGMRVTIVTSGMGQPSLEIVLGELVALREFDLKTRTRLPGHRAPLNIIRLGTSGALQPTTELGTAIITNYSVGLDNTGVYYDIAAPDATCVEIEGAVRHALQANARPNARFADRTTPYVSRAEPAMVKALAQAADEMKVLHKVGGTASASGFFCNQGRWLVNEAPPTVPDIDDVVSHVEVPLPTGEKYRVENMEMETSFLCHIGSAMHYRCGAICIVIAQRRACKFIKGSNVPYVENAGRVAIAALEKLQQLDH